jgi:hypothetical protein
MSIPVSHKIPEDSHHSRSLKTLPDKTPDNVIQFLNNKGIDKRSLKQGDVSAVFDVDSDGDPDLKKVANNKYKIGLNWEIVSNGKTEKFKQTLTITLKPPVANEEQTLLRTIIAMRAYRSTFKESLGVKDPAVAHQEAKTDDLKNTITIGVNFSPDNLAGRGIVEITNPQNEGTKLGYNLEATSRKVSAVGKNSFGIIQEQVARLMGKSVAQPKKEDAGRPAKRSEPAKASPEGEQPRPPPAHNLDLRAVSIWENSKEKITQVHDVLDGLKEAPTYHLRGYANVAAKHKDVDLDDSLEESTLHNKYGTPLLNVERTAMSKEYADDLSRMITTKHERKPDGEPFKVEEFIALQRIRKQRDIVNQYASALTSYIKEASTVTPRAEILKKELIGVIKENIAELGKLPSRNVVVSEEGVASFTIPLGTFKQPVCLEICRYPNGRHTLIIHNRGPGIEDESIHGLLEWENESGKLVRKTSVQIDIPDVNLLMNDAFWGQLIERTPNSNISVPEGVYKPIKDYILANGGQIQVSEVEKNAIKLYQILKEFNDNIGLLNDQRHNLENLIAQENDKKSRNQPYDNKLLDESEKAHKDIIGQIQAILEHREETENEFFEVAKVLQATPAFDTEQTFNTGTESNLTLIEKKLAPKNIRRILKLFSITNLSNKIAEDIQAPNKLSSEQKADAKAVIQDAKTKTERLKRKISKKQGVL